MTNNRTEIFPGIFGMKWHATSMLRVCNFTPGVLSGYQFYVLKGFSQAQGGMFGAAPPPPPRYVLNQLPPPPTSPRDTHLKLIRSNFVVHGCIDGYSRLVVHLNVSTNNLASTALNYFFESVTEYGIPGKIRVDGGSEFPY